MQLHNVTVYAAPGELEEHRAFYLALYGRDPVWEQPGHIHCFGSADLAVCLHEEEPGHPPGSRELFFWTDTSIECRPTSSGPAPLSGGRPVSTARTNFGARTRRGTKCVSTAGGSSRTPTCSHSRLG